MRYFPIDNSLFINNRKNFAKQLKPNSIAIFNSNDVMPTNADGIMGFRQNNDLFYLSGIDQENTLLILYPDHSNHELREILLVIETNELIAIWEGHKFTKQEAQQISGITNVQWEKETDTILAQLVSEADQVYLNSNEHPRSANKVETRDERFSRLFREKYPNAVIEKSAPILHHLRAVKSDIEVQMISEACNITKKAFHRVLDKTRPGMYEYQLEAEITHEFLRNRSRGHAYTPIIASGANACVLHYVSNNDQIKEGDLILMDFGAEYGNYNADLTRCVPASGKFTQRQKEIYNAVLRTQRFAINLLHSGTLLVEYTKEVCSFIEKELIGLGLITQSDIDQQDPKNPAYRKYFMHGVSHSLGLDVHDVDNRERPFEAGMVYTCEPGIYVLEEGIGVRIENDILITNDGPVDLMKDIPVEVDDIEALMNA